MPKSAQPPKSATLPSDQSVKSMRSAKSGTSIRTLTAMIPRVPAKAFFSRMAAPLRRARSRSQQKTYEKIEEERLLSSGANAQRRGSDDSDKTLVDDTTAPEEVSPPADPLSASQMLDVLAPLISSLQRITPRLAGSSVHSDEAKNDHAAICGTMLQFIDELKQLVSQRRQAQSQAHDDGEKTRPILQDHDLEMTSLMLDALGKKVEKEKSEMYRLAVVESFDETDDSEWEESVVAKAELVRVQRGADGSPLLPATTNPLVLHSTSITLSARRGSENRPIPAGQTTAAPKIHSSFVSGVQPTWSRNVIRLGSYQNSFLFSPSPVAVRPMVGISQQL